MTRSWRNEVRIINADMLGLEEELNILLGYGYWISHIIPPSHNYQPAMIVLQREVDIKPEGEEQV